MAKPVGETSADSLDVELSFGLGVTSIE